MSPIKNQIRNIISEIFSRKEKEQIVKKAKELFPYDGNKMFIRNDDYKTVFYLWSAWLFKNFNQSKLSNLKVGETISNSKGTEITRIY